MQKDLSHSATSVTHLKRNGRARRAASMRSAGESGQKAKGKLQLAIHAGRPWRREKKKTKRRGGRRLSMEEKPGS